MKSIKFANLNEIIFVDDDEAELVISQRYLKRSGVPHPAITFQSGKDFLSYMKAVMDGVHKMQAIVLLDVRMPEMDGFEVIEKIRQQDIFQDIPIIVMLSNSDASADVRKAYDKGADGYQTKFNSAHEFIAFFQAFLPDKTG